LHYVSHGDTLTVIKNWSHKGLKQFFLIGRTTGIAPDHAPRLARQLRHLNDASQPYDMNIH
jgi:proteic killer suppression protein